MLFQKNEGKIWMKNYWKMFHMGLNGGFTPDEIKNVIKEATINGNDLRKKLYESIQ